MIMMFLYTINLKLLDISNFIISPNIETNYIFYGSNPYTKIINKKQINKFLELKKNEL